MRYLASLVYSKIYKSLKIIEDQYNFIKQTIENVTSECKHPLESCREYPMQDNSFSTNPPYIICLDCGLTEEGWGCGYKKFRHVPHDIAKISRQDWLDIQTKSVIQ